MAVFTVEVDGRRYELPDFSAPTIREAREIKRETGFSPIQLFDALQEGDPDAWGGLVLLAMRKVDPAVTVDAVADLDLFELLAAFEAEVLAADPPPVAAGDAASDPANSSTGELTPVTSGTTSSPESSQG